MHKLEMKRPIASQEDLRGPVAAAVSGREGLGSKQSFQATCLGLTFSSNRRPFLAQRMGAPRENSGMAIWGLDRPFPSFFSTGVVLA